MHDGRVGRTSQRVRVLALAGLLALAVASCGKPSRQDEVADRGGEVMPFDLDATTHEFVSAPMAGPRRSPATPTIPSRSTSCGSTCGAEADAFRAGDFDDPATIHGREMPGLAEMAAGAGRGDI